MRCICTFECIWTVQHFCCASVKPHKWALSGMQCNGVKNDRKEICYLLSMHLYEFVHPYAWCPKTLSWTQFNLCVFRCTARDSPFHPDRHCNSTGQEPTERKHGNRHVWCNDSQQSHTHTHTSAPPLFSCTPFFLFPSAPMSSSGELKITLMGFLPPFCLTFYLTTVVTGKR